MPADPARLAAYWRSQNQRSGPMPQTLKEIFREITR